MDGSAAQTLDADGPEKKAARIMSSEFDNALAGGSKLERRRH